ncbi:AzlC family ABC transporter permease [Tistrella bauzanensis]|uniref:AzlC family ABC transporter permease n=1 Tax=Tistrella bauzanensis TaxID=657419 RepID=UPI0016697DFC|nr:AzlC family ABC transporter permease [Tistrella bauzanensis]
MPAISSVSTVPQPFRQGLTDAIPVAVTFLFIFTAYGAVARDAGLGIAQAVAVTVAVFAAPAQFVILGPLTAHAWATVAGIALVVNFRILLMGAALVPHYGGLAKRHVLPPLMFLSASTFALGYTYAAGHPEIGAGLKFRYYLGVVAISLPLAAGGSAAGFVVADVLPPALNALLLLVMPVYFTTLLAKAARRLAPFVAGLTGFVLVDPVDQLAPGFGLMIVAVCTGLAIVAVEELARRHRA